MLDLVEHMHTLMHFRLRGPVLDRMLHHTLPRGPNADLLAFITSLLLSSYFLVLPLWSSSPFDLCIDRTTSKKACLPHSLLIPFAPVSSPQPWALFVPKMTKLTLLSCVINVHGPLSQVCAQNPRVGTALPECPVLSVLWLGHRSCPTG